MNLVDRAKNIIVTPKTEWPKIISEEPNTSRLMSAYVLPLALLPAVAELIGRGFIGTGILKSFSWGIALALVQFITAFIVIYLTAFIIDALAPSFSSQKNFGRALQLVAYSFTPAFVGGILNIFPSLSWIGSLFGLYGFYIMYIGFPSTMKTPEDKVAIYLVISVLILIISYFIIAAVLTVILLAMFGISVLGASSIG